MPKWVHRDGPAVCSTRSLFLPQMSKGLGIGSAELAAVSVRQCCRDNRKSCPPLLKANNLLYDVAYLYSPGTYLSLFTLIIFICVVGSSPRVIFSFSFYLSHALQFCFIRPSVSCIVLHIGSICSSFCLDSVCPSHLLLSVDIHMYSHFISLLTQEWFFFLKLNLPSFVLSMHCHEGFS